MRLTLYSCTVALYFPTRMCLLTSSVVCSPTTLTTCVFLSSFCFDIMTDTSFFGGVTMSLSHVCINDVLFMCISCFLVCICN